jgi:hypothetical protein
MTIGTSVFQRELDTLEGNKRAETKRELTRLSVVCKDQPDEVITRKLKKLLGSGLKQADLTTMVAALKTGDGIDLK